MNNVSYRDNVLKIKCLSLYIYSKTHIKNLSYNYFNILNNKKDYLLYFLKDKGNNSRYE